MSKTNKFGEFYSQLQNKKISVRCLNENNYRQYTNDMFCPYCHQAKLSFILYSINNTLVIVHTRMSNNLTRQRQNMLKH